MAKNDPEQVVAGAGLLSAIFTKLNTAVVRKGGQPGALHCLSTPAGDALIEQFADIIVGQNGETYEEQLDYDQFRTIQRDRYAFLGEVTMNDVPETEMGIKPVRFRELEFDHDPTDQEVLDEAKRKKCRQPSRAEAETAARRYTAEQLGEHPRIGLIGPAVRRYGNLDRVYVYGGRDGVDLDWGWAGHGWSRGCRFVVVCE